MMDDQPTIIKLKHIALIVVLFLASHTIMISITEGWKKTFLHLRIVDALGGLF